MGPADAAIICCYTLGSLGGILGLFPRWQSLRKPSAWAIAAGFMLHTASIAGVFLTGDVEDLTKGAILRLMAWSLVFVYCVTWWRLRFSFLGITAGPLALVLFLASGAARNVSGGLPPMMTGAFFFLHLSVLFLNLALVTLGLGSALYFLSLHRKLKAKTVFMDSNGGNTPALATVDRLNKYVVLAGFPLFTIGLVTGFAWAEFARGAVFTADPKEIASVLLWLLYAFVFMQRAVFGVQGKKAAAMLVVLFFAMLFSLVGVNVFMDSHHNLFRSGMF